jgi:flagellar hook-associated protein 1
MSLNSSLSIATSGLANISAQFVTLSQNIANVSTPGYADETNGQEALTAGGIGSGVRTGVAVAAANTVLSAALNTQVSTTSNLTTTQTALQALDATLGTPGQGDDLSSLLGNLQTSFATLQSDPSSQPQQSAVVNAASTLAQSINNISDTITQQRQAAQDDLTTAVNALNGTLSQIGQLNQAIVAGNQAGTSVADLVNQRSGALQTLAGLVSYQSFDQPDGSVQLIANGGLILPTQAGTTPFTAPTGATPPQSFYPGGGLSGITLNGADVTSGLTGGEIGADITLRDTTLPTAQAQVDELAFNLATRFAGQGLTLFTDNTGNLPTATGASAASNNSSQSGYVGFAADIQVNPIISATPSLARDGTNSVVDSSTGGGDFTPNPPGGPAGFTGLITNVLDFAFGDQVQPGVSQPAPKTINLGPGGNLSAPFGGDPSLSDFTASIVSGLAEQSANVTANLTTSSSLETSLSSQLTSQTGVNVDSELSKMLTLQNAYGANARVLNAVQTMFTQILDAVQ